LAHLQGSLPEPFEESGFLTALPDRMESTNQRQTNPMVGERRKPINSPLFEESGMLPSNTTHQPGNIEARETISGLPGHPHNTVQARTQ
jgi:hypothetical protein